MNITHAKSEQPNIEEVFDELKRLTNDLTLDSVPEVIAKLLFIRDKPVKMCIDDCREKIAIIDALLLKIKSYNIQDLSNMMSALALNKFFIIDNTATFVRKKEEKDFGELLAEILVKAMIRCTQKEIDNSVDFFFNQDKQNRKKFDLVRQSLKNIYEIEDQKLRIKGIHHFLLTVTNEDLKKILGWFIYKEIYDPVFFHILYVRNEELYAAIFDLIINESFYKRKEFFKILPRLEVNFTTVEFNPEILSVIFQRFPKLRSQIIGYLKTKEKKRQWLVNLIIEFYAVFDEQKLSEVDITDQEHVHVCSQKPEHLQFAYDFLSKNWKKNNDSEIYLKFIEELLKNQQSLEDIFLGKKEAGDEFFLYIFKLICTTRRLESNILSFFENNFMEERFFYILACQLPKAVIFNKMEILLKNEASLLQFVALLAPREIYSQIHYFKDIKNQMTGSGLITSRKDIFDENVSLETLRYLVTKDLPPLFFRTVILTLTRFPDLKEKVVGVLKDAAQQKFWNESSLLQGFVKTLTILKENGMEALLELPQNIIEDIICRNTNLLHIAIKYVAKNDFIPGKNGAFFKRLIMREKRRCKL